MWRGIQYILIILPVDDYLEATCGTCRKDTRRKLGRRDTYELHARLVLGGQVPVLMLVKLYIYSYYTLLSPVPYPEY